MLQVPDSATRPTRVRPRSSGDRAPASGAGCVGSNPTGGTTGNCALIRVNMLVRALRLLSRGHDKSLCYIMGGEVIALGDVEAYGSNSKAGT